MKRDTIVFLEDILKIIDLIEITTKNRSKEDFLSGTENVAGEA